MRLTLNRSNYLLSSTFCTESVAESVVELLAADQADQCCPIPDLAAAAALADFGLRANIAPSFADISPMTSRD
jgi:hypothetical protein